MAHSSGSGGQDGDSAKAAMGEPRWGRGGGWGETGLARNGGEEGHCERWVGNRWRVSVF